MMHIKDKIDCCGCSACYSICPKSCIRMEEDQEGCLYPVVNKDACIGCNLCEKVCPVNHPRESRPPIESYAAIHDDESIRLQSSSGGVFSALADWTIEKGGIVFGARFDDNWDVCHDWTDSHDSILSFRGSKYVQSRIGDCYRQVKAFLEGDYWVLFSGTSCQVAGLKEFLRKDYEKLITVDVICHGAPVPKAWRDYLKEIGSGLSLVSFRSKNEGWTNYHFLFEKQDGVVSDQVFHKNIYMKGFLSNLYLRPSCSSCHFKSGRCQSDITLGDYWGIQNIHPEINDDKGVSAVILYTEKASRIIKELPLKLVKTNIDSISSSNPAYFKPCAAHPKRKFFFSRTLSFSINVEKCLSTTLYSRVKRRLLSIVNR